jgi:hypothetical protein
MATTASITISSSDLTGDTLSISKTATFNKAGSSSALEQTIGVNHKNYTSTSASTIIAEADYTNNIAAKVYISNLSTDQTEYLIVNIGATVLGRLYAGDWMLVPYLGTEDVKITPSVATKMPVEWALFYE